MSPTGCSWYYLFFWVVCNINQLRDVLFGFLSIPSLPDTTVSPGIYLVLFRYRKWKHSSTLNLPYLYILKSFYILRRASCRNRLKLFIHIVSQSQLSFKSPSPTINISSLSQRQAMTLSTSNLLHNNIFQLNNRSRHNLIRSSTMSQHSKLIHSITINHIFIRQQ